MATCAWCHTTIRGPKIIIEGKWACGGCAYYLDQGRKPPIQDDRS